MEVERKANRWFMKMIIRWIPVAVAVLDAHIIPDVVQYHNGRAMESLPRFWKSFFFRFLLLLKCRYGLKNIFGHKKKEA